jgi:hypothetical protein
MQPILLVDLLDEIGNTQFDILDGAVFPKVEFLGLQCCFMAGSFLLSRGPCPTLDTQLLGVQSEGFTPPG